MTFSPAPFVMRRPNHPPGRGRPLRVHVPAGCLGACAGMGVGWPFCSCWAAVPPWPCCTVDPLRWRSRGQPPRRPLRYRQLPPTPRRPELRTRFLPPPIFGTDPCQPRLLRKHQEGVRNTCTHHWGKDEKSPRNDKKYPPWLWPEPQQHRMNRLARPLRKPEAGPMCPNPPLPWPFPPEHTWSRQRVIGPMPRWMFTGRRWYPWGACNPGPYGLGPRLGRPNHGNHRPWPRGSGPMRGGWPSRRAATSARAHGTATTTG